MVATTLAPDRYKAVLFDMDGVITDTASLHAEAWKRLFDHYLATRPLDRGEDHRAFDDEDYRCHVDGKPRVDGVIDFLASRSIDIPRGSPQDLGAETAHGLGKLKDAYFQEALAAGEIRLFDGVVALIELLRRHGVRTAVISASRNCRVVLERAGALHLFDARVDGVLAEELGLPGKPDPATFLQAARALGVTPAESVVVEDSQAGVEAASRGGFALVIGVSRTGAPDRLLAAGANAVVTGLSDITVSAPGAPEQRRLFAVADALTHWDQLAAQLRGRALALLFDFDGTLTPIMGDPAEVTLPPDARQVLQELTRFCAVAVISGRDLHDVRQRVGVSGLWYAGSHGFELATPQDEIVAHEGGKAAVPDLDEAERLLSAEFADAPGVMIDRKRFALAVHYRHALPDTVEHVLTAVRGIGERLPGLTTTHGRLVTELLPNVDWNKGRALLWLLDQLRSADSDVLPLYAGDDLTDEDALHAIRDTGVGIVVSSEEHGDRLTWAHYSVDGPRSLGVLLRRIASLMGAAPARGT